MAEAMRVALKDTETKIARPSRTAEFRVTGLDESTTEEKVSAAVAKACDYAEGNFAVGKVQRSFYGTGRVWAKAR